MFHDESGTAVIAAVVHVNTSAFFWTIPSSLFLHPGDGLPLIIT
nr:hypothetical protein [Tanacetum cinerariifolium]